MRMDPDVRSRTIHNALLSLLIYALPPLLMLVSFSLRGEAPWKQPAAVPHCEGFWRFTDWSSGHGFLIFMVIMGVAEFALGRYGQHWRGNEATLDILCIGLQGLAIGPFLAWLGPHLLPVVLPRERNLFAWVPFFWSVLILCVADDLTNYWYHRLHHEIPWLWRFHRTHHSAPYMGMAMANRQNVFYAIFVSQTYVTIVLVYLGLGSAAIAVHAAKKLITIFEHSSIPWDKPLYDCKWLHPLAWLLERLIVTPATHHAHHAAAGGDGVGNHKGNFATVFFLWDILFSTALISRRYPSVYGVADYEGDPWYAQIFWPVLKSNIPGSELAADGREPRSGDDLREAMATPAAGD